MGMYNILFLDDDEAELETFKRDIEELNEDAASDDYKIKGFFTSDVKEASYVLYTENISGVVLDLLLGGAKEAAGKDEELTGNIFLDNILSKEILPIAVRTNTPKRSLRYEKDEKKLLKVYDKTDSSIEMLESLIKEVDSDKFKLLGKNGELSQGMSEIFWKALPQNIDSLESSKGIVVRYVSSWLKNKYEYNNDEEDFSKQSPIEMYMIPNFIPRLCTGDILKKEDTYFVVMTPACDLSNSKCTKILLVKILDDYSVLDGSQKFNTCLEAAKIGGKKQKNNLGRFTRHNSKNRYHFLPKTPDFRGGVMDFQELLTVDYDSENQRINEDLNYIKLGVITDPFIRDIIARFGMYYQRQGQPDLDIDEVLRYY